MKQTYCKKTKTLIFRTFAIKRHDVRCRDLDIRHQTNTFLSTGMDFYDGQQRNQERAQLGT